MLKIGTRLINEANVAHVETGVLAQPPGRPPVNDAVRVHFLGGTPPLVLFGEDAAAAVAALEPKAPEPAADPAPAPPRPEPAKPAAPAASVVVKP